MVVIVSVAWAWQCAPTAEGWIPPPDGILPANGEVVYVERSGRLSTRGVSYLGVTADGVTTNGPRIEWVDHGPDAWSMVPIDPLEIGVFYLLGFELGTDEDHLPPVAPTASAIRVDVERGFDGEPYDGVHVEVAGIEARAELAVTDDEGLRGVYPLLGSSSVGRVACGDVARDLVLGDDLVLQIRNVDWAGNVSPWVDVPIAVQDREPPSAGCENGPSTAWSPFAWFARR